jgi:hypothetical protein
MRGRPRPIASELAEIRNRRPGVRVSLAGEDLYLTAEEEVLFEQKDQRTAGDRRARARHSARPRQASQEGSCARLMTERRYRLPNKAETPFAAAQRAWALQGSS